MLLGNEVSVLTCCTEWWMGGWTRHCVYVCVRCLYLLRTPRTTRVNSQALLTSGDSLGCTDVGTCDKHTNRNGTQNTFPYTYCWGKATQARNTADHFFFFNESAVPCNHKCRYSHQIQFFTRVMCKHLSAWFSLCVVYHNIYDANPHYVFWESFGHVSKLHQTFHSMQVNKQRNCKPFSICYLAFPMGVAH